jgi:excisionase family DNA binding protein
MPQAILSEIRSVEEAARRLGGVSKWTIYAWLSQGKLKKTKIGGRVMISETDLQAFIAACNPESGVPAQEDNRKQLLDGNK